MKDKLFLDTNVVIDLLGERVPFYDSIAKIATLADIGRIGSVVSALTYTTVYNLLSGFEDSETVREKIRKFKIIVDTSDLTGTLIEKGLSSGFRDFEDSLQYYCSLASDCNILITRNAKDYRLSDIPVLTPEEYLKSLKS